MGTTKICQHCGKVIGPEAVGGLCPECLMKVGLGSGVDGAPGAPGPSAKKPKAAVSPSLAEVAQLFPQLEIIQLLGQGGMGAVYKAHQPELDRLVALKVLPLEVGSDPGFAERFTREARALARLSHPNIVAVHEFGQVDGLHYFIMEYVDGVNLRQMEQAGKLAPREALQIIPHICEALQFAHDEGIVHRDIKPENVLLDKKGRVKIADFGLAKILGREPKNLRLTGVGDVMGTPHYMAPEQVEHPQEVDHRADIYSLGVVFYEMLTGELPLGKFAPPSQKVQVDVRLDEVVLHTLEKEPERRYQHASEVKTDVEAIAANSVPAAAAPASPRNVTWVPVLAGWTGRLLGLVGFLVVLLFVSAQGFPPFWNQPPSVQVELAATILMLVGLLVGWKSEGWGAFLIADGWTVFFIAERGLPPGPFTGFLIVAALYAYCWWERTGEAGRPWRAANRPARRWLLGLVAGISLAVAILPALLTGCAGLGEPAPPAGQDAAQKNQPNASHTGPLAWLKEEGIDLDKPEAKQAPYSQVSIEDLQPDGSSRFRGVCRETITGDQPREKIQFVSANTVELQQMFDLNGNTLPFKTIHSAPNYQYSATLAKAVPPGSALLYGSEGIIHNRAAEDPELGSFAYHYTHYPSPETPTRLVEIYRLPRGAELLEVSSKGTRRVRHGRIEIVFDELLAAGGGGTLSFRYRLSPPKAASAAARSGSEADLVAAVQHTNWNDGVEAWLAEEAVDLNSVGLDAAPQTQVVIEDLQPDGTSRFRNVIREVLEGQEPLGQLQFINSDFVEVRRVTDAEGNTLPFTTANYEGHFQYTVTLAKAVAPGSAITYGCEGIMRGKVDQEPELGTFSYRFTHSPNSGVPTRRVEVHRLPAGAQLLEVSSGAASRVRKGRTEIVLDQIVPAGGSITLAYRYRLFGGDARVPATPSTGPETTNAAQEQPPTIVSTSPRVGDTDVDPAITEITVTFDRDMGAGFSWTGGGPEHPVVPEGSKVYWRDKRTCVYPVKLEAAHYYRVGINSTSFQSFASDHGVAALPSAIFFTTQGASEELKAKTLVPQALRFDPENGAQNVSAAVTELRVTFSVPMGGGFSWCCGDENDPPFPKGRQDKGPYWTDDHLTCVLPVMLEAGRAYQIGINCPSAKNFQSAGGVPLEPLAYTFRTKE